MNGLRIKFCKWDDWSTQQVVEISKHDDGEWRSMKHCPENSYISEVEYKYEYKQEDKVLFDHTGGNGLKIRCRKKIDFTQYTDIIVWDGKWGRWIGWSKYEKDFFLTGANNFYRSGVGSNGLAIRLEYYTH